MAFANILDLVKKKTWLQGESGISQLNGFKVKVAYADILHLVKISGFKGEVAFANILHLANQKCPQGASGICQHPSPCEKLLQSESGICQHPSPC